MVLGGFLAGCGGGNSQIASAPPAGTARALNNGEMFQLPLASDIETATEVPYLAEAYDPARGMTIPGTHQFSYEGARLGQNGPDYFDGNLQNGQCAVATRSLYKARFNFDIGPTGGDGGAYNYSSRRNGMTQISATGDPRPMDMVVFANKQGAKGSPFYTYGHVGTVAYVVGNKQVCIVDSNWVASVTGGCHVIDLKQYNVMYQRPNDPPAGYPPKPRLPDNSEVSYRGHFQDTGDFVTVSYGEVLGDVLLSKRMEAIQVTSAGRNISYQVHVQNVGWMDVVKNGALAGTTGRGLRIEAVRMWVDRGRVEYWVYVNGVGWSYGTQGSTGGSTGQGRLIEAIAIRVTG